jgi:hypothetical protein
LNKRISVLPRIAIQSIGGGLLLMALFTTMWSGIAEGGLQGSDNYLVIIIFSVFSLTFIVYGIYLFLIAKRFPKISTDAERLEGKRIGKWYGIIFGIEGTTIPIVVFILLAFHLGDFIIPSIALIVGLHFYPMAKIFNRKIDYYLATWTCIIALIGIIMTIMQATQFEIFPFVGIGVALATTSYGTFMLFTAYKHISKRV